MGRFCKFELGQRAGDRLVRGGHDLGPEEEDMGVVKRARGEQALGSAVPVGGEVANANQGADGSKCEDTFGHMCWTVTGGNARSKGQTTSAGAPMEWHANGSETEGGISLDMSGNARVLPWNLDLAK